jgi:hypothetical protein
LEKAKKFNPKNSPEICEVYLRLVPASTLPVLLDTTFPPPLLYALIIFIIPFEKLRAPTHRIIELIPAARDSFAPWTTSRKSSAASKSHYKRTMVSFELQEEYNRC